MTSESGSFVALRSAIEQAGSQTAFARLLGVTQQAVSGWVLRKKTLPAEHVLLVEAATGISRHELRPDIYPIESSGLQSPPEGALAAVPKLAVAGVPESLKGLQT